MKHTTTTLASALVLFLSLAQPVLALPDDEVRNDESQRTAQQEPKVKPGGKDDIDAIGNRDVGGRRAGELVLAGNRDPNGQGIRPDDRHAP